MGLAVFGGAGFVLGWMFGLSAFTVGCAALLTMAMGIGFGARPAILLARPGTKPTWRVLILVALSAGFITRLADRTLFETDLGIATGDRHNFGDLPFHMAISAGFAYGDNFPPDHPELAGVPLTYPFLGDLVSGMVLAAGGSWRDAFFWPTLILGLSVVVALVRFGEAVTGSRAAGRVAALLTFFSGGLGFLTLSSVESVSRWWTMGPDLTMNDAGLRYANFVTTLFIPQRSILFGWPLLFFSLSLLVTALLKDEEEEPGSHPSRARLWTRAGIIGSFLPLVHSHSFAVLGFCALVFAARAPWPAVIGFARGVLPVALPAILFMLTRNSLSTGSFFAWQPGFDGGASNPIRYWLMNAGLFLPLVIVGLAIARSRSVRPTLAIPFVTLFILANLFRLSPWIWDNMKFLAPAHAGLAPFAALTLLAAWRSGWAGKTVAGLGLLLAVSSGALDVSKVAFAGGEFGVFTRADLAFAEKVRAAVPPTATILTAPTHNHPVLLSGRRVFLGYEGHLWSQGLTYAARKPVAATMFVGGPQPVSGPSLPRVDAIALSPAEQGLTSTPNALLELPSLVDSPYRLVQVR